MISQATPWKQLRERYASALQAAVAACSTEAAAERAKELGARALELGLDTLDLAGLHQQALRELTPSLSDPEANQRLIARAAVFFNATLTALAAQSRRASGSTGQRSGRACAEETRPDANGGDAAAVPGS